MKPLLILICAICCVLPAQAFDLEMIARLNNLTGGSAAPSYLTPDLLGWKLNEGTGTALASASTATGTGGTTDAGWVTGKSGLGYALDFNGSSQKAASTNAVTYGTNQITVSFWWYPDDTNANQVFIQSGDGYWSSGTAWIVYVNAGSVLAGCSSAAFGAREESFTAPATGGWHHVLVVFDSTTSTGDVKMYLDGSAQSTSITSDGKVGTDAFAARTLRVGTTQGTSEFLNGRLDDIRIYSGDRSGSVSTIYGEAQ